MVVKVRFAIPKGHLEKATFEMLEQAGYVISGRERTYRPAINDPNIELKILRPQEIPIFVGEGLQDIGITGIDWVKETENQAKWQTMNYTNINTYGGEFATKIFFNKWFGKKAFLQSIDINYMYLFIDQKEQEFISKYVYDYLVHNASMSFSLHIYKGVGATAQINYQDRKGDFEKYNFATGETLTTNYEPTILANAKLFWNYKFFSKNIIFIKFSFISIKTLIHYPMITQKHVIV